VCVQGKSAGQTSISHGRKKVLVTLIGKTVPKMKLCTALICVWIVTKNGHAVRRVEKQVEHKHKV